MITAFLPCRKGSQRIPDKNTKSFAGIDGGLLKIKLLQLLKCDDIDKIIVSSNDIRVLDIAGDMNHSKITLDHRPDSLGSSSTTTDVLISYCSQLIKEGDILWTHVTSPFINEKDYEQLIQKYYGALANGFDSLMTVLKLQGFIWDENGPLSYDRKHLKWPMTQNIQPLFEIDSGVFISSAENYKAHSDRIGRNPLLVEQEKLKSIDIDWPQDFHLAELLWKINH